MEKEQLIEKIGEIKTEISSYKLNISRVPKPTYKRFIELADADFASDYGATLHFILSYFDGLMPTVS